MDPNVRQREWDRIRREAETLGEGHRLYAALKTAVEDGTAHIGDGERRDRAKIRHAWSLLASKRQERRAAV